MQKGKKKGFVVKNTFDDKLTLIDAKNEKSFFI